MLGGRLLLLVVGLLRQAHGQAHRIRLSGACGYLNFLNGLVFEKKGRTRNGAPWYQGLTQGYYIYYDTNCGGSNDGSPRWIIDNDKPSQTLWQDLDSDHDCVFHARVDSDDNMQPPPATSWEMYCNGKWLHRDLVLEEVLAEGPPSTTTITTTTTMALAYLLQVDGACGYMNYLNGMVFERMGFTLTGAPYYKSQTADYYIYYDPDCQGAIQGFSRWIIDDSKPSLTKLEDLDSDHDCIYQARVDSADLRGPPRSANWHMQCSASWEDHHLTFVEIVTTTTGAMTTTMAPETTSTTIAPTTGTTVTMTTTGTHTTTTRRMPAPTSMPASTSMSTSAATPTPATTTTSMELAESTTVTVTMAVEGTHMPTATATATTIAHEATATVTTTMRLPNNTIPEVCKGIVCPAGTALRTDLPGMAEVGNTTCCTEVRHETATTTVTIVEEEVPSTVTGTAAVAATTTAAATTEEMTTSRRSFVLEGACEQNLNGLKFSMQGKTASGAAYYKAEDQELYIYYDPNCASVETGAVARWILDNNAPSTTRENDLDDDADCNYLARLDASGSSSAPPASATWKMYCGSGWADRTLVLQEEYAEIKSGTCADVGRFPILEAGVCSEAATYLGLSSTKPVSVPNADRPEGCAWDAAKAELQLALNAENKGNGARNSWHPLCSVAVAAEQQAVSASGSLPLRAVVAFVMGLWTLAVVAW